MDFTVVMPIHNEERFLPYSLPSVYRISPNEVILIFDRCTDQSIQTARKIASLLRSTDITKFVELSDPVDWNWRLAYLIAFGIEAAGNQVILITDADYILNEKVKAGLVQLGQGLGIISFGRREYPPTFQNLTDQLLAKLHHLGLSIPVELFSGSFAVLKKAYDETVDINDFKKVPRSLDTFIYDTIVKKYRSAFVEARGLHLRPRESSKRHFIRGIDKYRLQHHPLWKVILHSLFYLRPLVLAGYLKARFSETQKS